MIPIAVLVVFDKTWMYINVLEATAICICGREERRASLLHMRLGEALRDRASKGVILCDYFR